MVHNRPAFKILVGIGTAAVAVLSACNEPHGPLTANQLSNEKMDEAKAKPKGHFRQMADNAMLSDMSVWDHHFVPHTSELSGTGAERLSRMAMYLDTYGGKVQYDTRLDDKDLVQKRIDHVREYLEVTGTDMSRVEVVAGLSGGRMITAVKAIAADDKGTAKPQASSGAPTTVIGPAPNP